MEAFMKRVLLLLTIVLILTSCPSIVDPDSSLVGDWGTMGVKMMTFTSDGQWIVYSGASSTVYSYTASDGSGSYWLSSNPGATVPFTYVISGQTMTLTIMNISISYTKM